MQALWNAPQFVFNFLFNEQDEEAQKQAKQKCTDLAREEYKLATNSEQLLNTSLSKFEECLKVFQDKKDRLLLYETSLRIQLRRLQVQTDRQLDVDPSWINKDDLTKFDEDETQGETDNNDQTYDDLPDCESDFEQGQQFKDADTLTAEQNEQRRLLNELKQEVHPLLIKLNDSIKDYEMKIASLKTKLEDIKTKKSELENIIAEKPSENEKLDVV